jgi:hypothetical protein
VAVWQLRRSEMFVVSKHQMNFEPRRGGMFGSIPDHVAPGRSLGCFGWRFYKHAGPNGPSAVIRAIRVKGRFGAGVLSLPKAIKAIFEKIIFYRVWILATE